MTTEEALVYAALASPEDRTAQLVLADWLDENGHADQAEAIRIRCALAAPGGDADRAELQLRLQCRPQWRAAGGPEGAVVEGQGGRRPGLDGPGPGRQQRRC